MRREGEKGTKGVDIYLVHILDTHKAKRTSPPPWTSSVSSIMSKPGLFLRSLPFVHQETHSKEHHDDDTLCLGPLSVCLSLRTFLYCRLSFTLSIRNAHRFEHNKVIGLMVFPFYPSSPDELRCSPSLPFSSNERMSRSAWLWAAISRWVMLALGLVVKDSIDAITYLLFKFEDSSNFNRPFLVPSLPALHSFMLNSFTHSVTKTNKWWDGASSMDKGTCLRK